MSGILGGIKDRFFSKPDPTEFILEMKMHNNDIKRVQRQNEKKSNELRAKAKKEMKSGSQARVKLYMNQYMKAKSTAFSLDMFTITIEGLIFDLQNASSLQNIGLTMGKINKTLDKLGVLNISDVSKMMGQVNKQMARYGIAMDTVYSNLSDYDSFSVESYTEDDVTKEMELLSDEVLAETGTMPEKLSELMEKREKLNEK